MVVHIPRKKCGSLLWKFRPCVFPPIFNLLVEINFAVCSFKLEGTFVGSLLGFSFKYRNHGHYTMYTV